MPVLWPAFRVSSAWYGTGTVCMRQIGILRVNNQTIKSAGAESNFKIPRIPNFHEYQTPNLRGGLNKGSACGLARVIHN